jgi:hypothetical protein
VLADGDSRLSPSIHRLRHQLTPASREIDRIIEPDSHEWRYMRSAVRSNGRDPEQLGLFECPASLIPVGRDRVRLAKARVELSQWLPHQGAPFDRGSREGSWRSRELH